MKQKHKVDILHEAGWRMYFLQSLKGHSFDYHIFMAELQIKTSASFKSAETNSQSFG